ncbi:hypothetical protein QOT17_014403 [Balamuthia mandrillaris]
MFPLRGGPPGATTSSASALLSSSSMRLVNVATNSELFDPMITGATAARPYSGGVTTTREIAKPSSSDPSLEPKMVGVGHHYTCAARPLSRNPPSQRADDIVRALPCSWQEVIKKPPRDQLQQCRKAVADVAKDNADNEMRSRVLQALEAMNFAVTQELSLLRKEMDSIRTTFQEEMIANKEFAQSIISQYDPTKGNESLQILMTQSFEELRGCVTNELSEMGKRLDKVANIKQSLSKERKRTLEEILVNQEMLCLEWKEICEKNMEKAHQQMKDKLNQQIAQLSRRLSAKLDAVASSWKKETTETLRQIREEEKQEKEENELQQNRKVEETKKRQRAVADAKEEDEDEYKDQVFRKIIQAKRRRNHLSQAEPTPPSTLPQLYLFEE